MEFTDQNLDSLLSRRNHNFAHSAGTQIGDTLSMHRKKFLSLKKNIGWWVEFNDSHEEYRMMENRKSYIKITEDEYDYFKYVRSMYYHPKLAKLNSNQYEAITTFWSEYDRLKNVFRGVEWSIDQYFVGNPPENKDYSRLIDTCIAYGIVRDRLELIKPPQGKIGSWKTFLKLE